MKPSKSSETIYTAALDFLSFISREDLEDSEGNLYTHLELRMGDTIYVWRSDDPYGNKFLAAIDKFADVLTQYSYDRAK